ncbi:MAG: LAGLIDADG family homing endonuclease [Methanopyri archaeon]|nr:LAGLIDADG family homing endonuclease [Methanopyri archaeon]
MPSEISDSEQVIQKFENFFNTFYNDELLRIVREGESSIKVDFRELDSFDIDLADDLLNRPRDILACAEEAITRLDLGEDFVELKVRFEHLPESQGVYVRDLRSDHLGKFICIEGLIRQASDVRPEILEATFDCPNCGNLIIIPQTGPHLREPTKCICGRKGKFRMTDKKLTDMQKLEVEELPDNLIGGEQAKRLRVFIRDDLVDPTMGHKVIPGTEVFINGTLGEVTVTSSHGQPTRRLDIFLDANFIDPKITKFEDIEVSAEDEEEIRRLAADPHIYRKLKESIAPSIYGYDEIKEALSLFLFGGIRKRRKDGTETRGDIHILLIGDPGAGKSMMLKYIEKLAPKARYVSGKGASAAGLTASVVKDEFLKSWVLEAGTLVLANKGIACIDELDKMGQDDRSAMHEAMEQQSYHPNVEIMLADGSSTRIGEFVDGLMSRGCSIKGKDCEILSVNDVFLQSTDFHRVMPIKADRVSRHKAPDTFIRIEYGHGRAITVTPEHPVFVFRDGRIREVRADEVMVGDLAPAPSTYNLDERPEVGLSIPDRDYHPNRKEISLPGKLTPALARLLGYVVSEGHVYVNEGNYQAEVGISNTDRRIIDDSRELFRKEFGTEPLLRVRGASGRDRARKDLFTISCPSRTLYEFFRENFPELCRGSLERRVPDAIKRSGKEVQREFLASAFKGDGFVDGNRFGFITGSYGLAQDMQDLLLWRGVWSYIAFDRRSSGTYYKVVVSGTDSMRRFSSGIVEGDDPRMERVRTLCERSGNRRNYRDPVPGELVARINALMKELRMSDGYFVNILKRGQSSNRQLFGEYLGLVESRLQRCREAVAAGNQRRTRKALAIPAKEVARELGVSTSTVYNWEHHDSGGHGVLSGCVDRMASEKLDRMESESRALRRFVDSDIRLVRVKKTSRVENEGVEWVYDVTVEPTGTFVSEGLVLHNTVTISKASIQASLKAQTAILAAANPKHGRFDPYQPPADQIDLPPTLINRFDLIFPIRDKPDREKDTRMADHILHLHSSIEDQKDPPISGDLMRKYISFAKRNSSPRLTEAAINEIQNFFVGLRGQYSEKDRSVPISVRQLESMIRLSAAAARVWFTARAAAAHAQRAIRLIFAYLKEVGFDPETGKLDVDRASGVTPASKRNLLTKVLGIIRSLEEVEGSAVKAEDVLREASGKGMDELEVEKVIRELMQVGEIFEPQRGYIKRL